MSIEPKSLISWEYSCSGEWACDANLFVCLFVSVFGHGRRDRVAPVAALKYLVMDMELGYLGDQRNLLLVLNHLSALSTQMGFLQIIFPSA